MFRQLLTRWTTSARPSARRRQPQASPRGRFEVLEDRRVLSVEPLWSVQFGTSSADDAYAVSTDGLGNVYVTGVTNGILDGTESGRGDVFVAKYDASGTELWITQFSSPGFDYEAAYGISADGLGNVYVAGETEGNLGGSNAGNYDLFVAKLDVSGTILWTEQLGTVSYDAAFGISADGLGNVYVGGWTDDDLGGPTAGPSDYFVAKYDASGNLLWVKQFGSTEVDEAYDITADSSGNVYVTGSTDGDLAAVHAGGYSDAFVTKLDASGSLIWSKQFGTAGDDYIDGVSVDEVGNVYVAGYTDGVIGDGSVGGDDAFIAKLDASGSLLWIEQFGTSSSDYAHGVSVNGLGNVYVLGDTLGDLGGSNVGSYDVFLAEFDVDGTLLSIQQFGSDEHEEPYSISTDGLGNVYLTGTTTGDLFGVNAGFSDVFVQHLAPNVFTVDTTSDAPDATPGDGVAETAGGFTSLRAAIQEANALGVPTTIVLPEGTFALDLTGTESGNGARNDLDITGNITIIGAGAGLTVIDAAGLSSSGVTWHSGAFEVGIGATLNLSGVTVTGGQSWSGGAVRTNGSSTVAIADSAFVGNAASTAGGALRLGGSGLTATIERSVFTENAATGDGGAIYVGWQNDTDVSIGSSVFVGNQATRYQNVRKEANTVNWGNNLTDDNEGSFFRADRGDYLGSAVVEILGQAEITIGETSLFSTTDTITVTTTTGSAELINGIDRLLVNFSAGAAGATYYPSTGVLFVDVTQASGLATSADIAAAINGEAEFTASSSGNSSINFSEVTSSTTTLTRTGQTAEDLVVTNVADRLDDADGGLSLREAVIAANAGDQTIWLPAWEYRLDRIGSESAGAAQNDLDITGDVTILGVGAGLSVINATDLAADLNNPTWHSGAFEVVGSSTVGAGGKLDLSRVTITGGRSRSGGAIRTGSNSELTVTDAAFVDNFAVTAGGALRIAGNNTVATISGSVFTDNEATNAGGAIYVGDQDDTAVTISSSVFAHNTATIFKNVRVEVSTVNGGNNLTDDNQGGFFSVGAGDYINTPAVAASGDVDIALLAQQATGTHTFGTTATVSFDITAVVGQAAEGAIGATNGGVDLIFVDNDNDSGLVASVSYNAGANELTITADFDGSAGGNPGVTGTAIADAIDADGTFITSNRSAGVGNNLVAADATTYTDVTTGGRDASTETISVTSATGYNLDITLVEAAATGATPVVSGDAGSGYTITIDDTVATTIDDIRAAIASITEVSAATYGGSASYIGSLDVPPAADSLAGGTVGSNPNVVTSLADQTNSPNGGLTLREAVIFANETPGPDEIWLAPWRYLLTEENTSGNEDLAATGDLDILEDLTLRSADAATVDASLITDAAFETIGATLTLDPDGDLTVINA